MTYLHFFLPYTVVVTVHGGDVGKTTVTGIPNQAHGWGQSGVGSSIQPSALTLLENMIVITIKMRRRERFTPPEFFSRERKKKELCS